MAVTPTPAAAETHTISVEVRSIAADRQTETIDAALSDLEPKLRDVFADYTSFELLERRSITISKDEEQSLTLPQGSELRIGFRGWNEELIELDLELGDKLSTTLRASPGSTFFQAGLSYDEGILILAITVERHAESD